MAAVFAVAPERMPPGGELHPDLMGPPGVESDVRKAQGSVRGGDAVFEHGFPHPFARAADREDPTQSLLEKERSAECPPGSAEGVPEPVEDARLYGEGYRRSFAAARKSKARPVTPPAQADRAEGAPLPAAIPAPPHPVRPSAHVRRPSGPLIENTQPLVGHSLGLSGTSKPPPREFN